MRKRKISGMSKKNKLSNKEINIKQSDKNDFEWNNLSMINLASKGGKSKRIKLPRWEDILIKK